MKGSNVSKKDGWYNITISYYQRVHYWANQSPLFWKKSSEFFYRFNIKQKDFLETLSSSFRKMIDELAPFNAAKQPPI